MVNNEQKIAVLIPCFNESRTIAKVIQDFQRELPDSIIYVYDNNSTDGTDQIAKDLGAIVRYESRQGKGNVVRSMFRDIDADCYILVDGDDTYPAEHAGRMVHLVLSEQKDMVIGDRLSSTYFSENTRRFHNTGNRLVRFFINHLFHSHIQDIMTGYRAFSRRFVKTMPVLCNGFEIETEMTIHALDKHMAIAEIPIHYRNRPEGSVSKLHTIRDGFQVLLAIFQLYRLYKPLQFSGILSGLMVLLSMVLFVPVFADYLKTGLVERFPTLIVSGFILLGAIVSFFSGLILDTITKKHRQLFEQIYHLSKDR